MLHSFVAARIVPSVPAWATYGRQVAPSHTTTPFLALHLHIIDSDRLDRTPNLFFISPEKPTSPGSEYFLLNHTAVEASNLRALTIVPPLPFKGPLYLSLTPRICATFQDLATYHQLVNAEHYQLDAASLDHFLQALSDAGPFIPAIRETGGEDEPAPNWDTWSDIMPREVPGFLVWRREVPFDFNLLPFDSLSTHLETRLMDQLALLRQLAMDYTWKDCRRTTAYVESKRKDISRLAASGHIFHTPVLLTSRPDSCVDALRPCTAYLQSLAIIYDGDPHEDEDEEANYWDSDEEEWPGMHVAAAVPAKRAEDVKVIIIDPYLLIDRDVVLQKILINVFPPSEYHFAAKELLDLYVEYETLRTADGRQASPTAIIQDVARYLSALVEASAVIGAIEHHEQLNLYPEASSTLVSLLDRGYTIFLPFPNHETLLGMPNLSLNIPSSWEYFLAFGKQTRVTTWSNQATPSPLRDHETLLEIPDLSLKTPSLWESFLASCKQIGVTTWSSQITPPSSSDHNTLSQVPGLSLEQSFAWESLLVLSKQTHSTIQPSQILVATSDIYRIGEPTSVAGLPIAFVNRAGSRSAELSIPTVTPTYTLATLTDLLPILSDPTSVPKPQDHVVNQVWHPIRILDCYQVTFLLGSGSFASVFNGIQVHTGMGVAIKLEAKPETLPYEAAVYVQLEGVTGVPRVHWSGLENTSYVIVMDKLGLTLEHLRRFCRGQLSLKTVLMLGEQMLSTIEQIHARGIIVRDIKPENFAMGLVEDYKSLYLFDFGLSKLYLDPTTGKHMPFREGRDEIGTPRYASHNVHFGLEPSRRDDIEAIGILLLYLLHGRLPWQGICAPSMPAKLRWMGEMKRGKPFTSFLAHSHTSACLRAFFEHCRSLEFADQPDYALLRTLLRREFEERGFGGEYDWEYDWWKGGGGERGTLIPEEYKLDMRLVEPVRHSQITL